MNGEIRVLQVDDDEIDVLLSSPAVHQAVALNLHLPARRIRAAYFQVQDQGMRLSTGLFEGDGVPVEEGPAVKSGPHERGVTDGREPRELWLGLRHDHPFIRNLAASKNPYRAYYALTFLAHELALCQSLLVPCSPFYHWVKNMLAADMRRGLLYSLTASSERALGEAPSGPKAAEPAA
jgi:hypothetical protein